jgi:hypothetical protein
MITKEKIYLRQRLFYGLPLAVLFVFFWLFSINLSFFLYTLFGYSWVWALNSPQLRGQVGQKQYKFSFLRLVFKFHDNLTKRLLLKYKPKVFSVGFFTLLFSLAFQNFSIVIWALVGAFAAEVLIPFAKSPTNSVN